MMGEPRKCAGCGEVKPVAYNSNDDITFCEECAPPSKTPPVSAPAGCQGLSGKVYPADHEVVIESYLMNCANCGDPVRVPAGQQWMKAYCDNDECRESSLADALDAASKEVDLTPLRDLADSIVPDYGFVAGPLVKNAARIIKGGFEERTRLRSALRQGINFQDAERHIELDDIVEWIRDSSEMLGEVVCVGCGIGNNEPHECDCTEIFGDPPTPERQPLTITIEIPEGDREIQSMAIILAGLERIDGPARQRVLEYMGHRIGHMEAL